jgi:hypothetical protein
MGFIVDAVSNVVGGVVDFISSPFQDDEDSGGSFGQYINAAANLASASTAAPAVPKQEDTLAAEQEQRKRVGLMQGRASTMLTAGGWQGLGSTADEDQMGGKIARRTLLG